jgi:hypothetical protein
LWHILFEAEALSSVGYQGLVNTQFGTTLQGPAAPVIEELEALSAMNWDKYIPISFQYKHKKGNKKGKGELKEERLKGKVGRRIQYMQRGKVKGA